MTGHRPEPLRLVQTVTPIWSGADDVLATATDAHREMDRLERERPSPHGDEPTNQRGDWQGQTPLLGRAISQSRARKARRHNRFAVALLMAASVLIGAIFYAASARADGAVDAWEAEYGPAACSFLGQHPTLAGLSGVILGAEKLGLSPMQAGEAVASSVLDVCPEYTPLLRDFVRRYGPVTA